MKLNRPQLLNEHFNKVLTIVGNNVQKRLQQKGRGGFVSTHEGYGVIAEEFDKELLDALHSNNYQKFFDESVDVAVACIIMCASMIAVQEEQAKAPEPTPEPPKDQRTKEEAIRVANALGWTVVD